MDFLKGHGTENDFVLLPDPDGSAHGDLSPGWSRPCATGARASAPTACSGWSAPRRTTTRRPSRRAARPSGSWTTATPTARSRRCAATGCGSSPATSPTTRASTSRRPLPVGTRAGVKVLTFDGRRWSASTWASPSCTARPRSSVGDRSWPAQHVSMGNPHAVAFVDDLADAGHLLDAPEHDAGDVPRRRQRRVRRAPRRAARRDAGARARLGGDPLLRHRRLRRDGRRRPGRRAPHPARRTASTSPAAGSTYLDRAGPGRARPARP